MGLFSSIKKIVTNPKNIAAAALAPMTGGTSLLMADIGGDSVLNHLTGAASAKEANEKNIALQNYWNERNIANQDKWNETTIELANTAHQREMADLKAAGINPILTGMGGSGAASPSFSSAQGVAPQVQNTMPGGYLQQASQVIGMMQGIGQASNLLTNSALQQAQTNQVNLDTAITQKMSPSTIKLAEQNVRNSIAQQQLVQNQTALTAEQTAQIQGGTGSKILGTKPGKVVKDTADTVKKQVKRKGAKDVINSNAWMGYPGLF